MTAAFVALVVGSLGVPKACAITIDMVTVGNPGNANDPDTGNLYGRVGYSYQIGKYNVTIAQYVAFLNAVAAEEDSYALYSSIPAFMHPTDGISRSGASGSYNYGVIGSGNKPIYWVSWFDAARFANWMHNGQGAGSTETGAYTLQGATSGNAVARNPGASFYIPTENEWYKAAYYSPLLNSGAGGYYRFATQSNTRPGNKVGSDPNQANHQANGVYSLNQSSEYPADGNVFTNVGAFSNSSSYYGTFDQNGAVFDWNDLDGVAGPYRGLRGGFWSSSAPVSSEDRWASADPVNEYYYGFRLVSAISAVPEIDPAGMGCVLALVTGALALLERRRLKAA